MISNPLIVAAAVRMVRQFGRSCANARSLFLVDHNGERVGRNRGPGMWFLWSGWLWGTHFRSHCVDRVTLGIESHRPCSGLRVDFLDGIIDTG